MYNPDEIIIKYIKANPSSNNSEISKELIKNEKYFKDKYTSFDSLRKIIRKIRTKNNLKVKEKQIPLEAKDLKIETVEEDLKLNNLKRSHNEYKVKYNFALEEIQKKDRLLDLAREIENKKIRTIKIDIDKSIDKNQGTAISTFSDLHFANRIEAKNINGFNELNPEIASQRVIDYFRNLRKLINKERQEIVLDNLVIASLGDLMHGFIHEEYLVTNYMTPIQEALAVYELLVNGLNYLLEDENLKKIVFIGKVGNHSRITLKPYSNAEALMSHEWGIYKHLEKYFENEPRIEFILEEGYFTYQTIYDKVNRFSHGHAVQYRGGIGGLTIPLIKYIHRANEQIRADMDYIGHFHTRFNLPNCLVNGSMCGFDSYALKIGARPELPMQQFQILDSKRGFTVNIPIILTN